VVKERKENQHKRQASITREGKNRGAHWGRASWRAERIEKRLEN